MNRDKEKVSAKEAEEEAYKRRKVWVRGKCHPVLGQLQPVHCIIFDDNAVQGATPQGHSMAG